MMDYARVKEIVGSETIEKAKALPHVVLPAMSMIVILFLFVFGFLLVRQSVIIGNLKHTLNVKRTELKQVDLKIYSLYKEYSYLVSADHVMSVAREDGMEHASPSSIVIVR